MKNGVRKTSLLLWLFFLLLPIGMNVEAASGNTEADVTFTQGDTPIIQPASPKEEAPQKWYSNMEKFLPQTGERVIYFWIIIGIIIVVITAFIIKKRKSTSKK